MDILDEKKERLYRTRMRLEGWDYSSEATYFLTICAKDKRPLFSKIVDRGLVDSPLVVLSVFGQCIEESLAFLENHNPALRICAKVIMPNHIHLLLTITDSRADKRMSGPPYTTNSDSERATPECKLCASGMPRATPCVSELSSPANRTIPKFVSALKRFTNRQCGTALWQNDYHDYIVRDERELFEIWQYIENNPARWLDDKYYIN
ncbi:MAG: hypothetical protein E7459_05580 [Ruminococcaceae bacterium]|nr:hypothetical protein [Oscillospiraceae bacterium]